VPAECLQIGSHCGDAEPACALLNSAHDARTPWTVAGAASTQQRTTAHRSNSTLARSIFAVLEGRTSEPSMASSCCRVARSGASVVSTGALNTEPSSPDSRIFRTLASAQRRRQHRSRVPLF
jgi:hypothetical protein